MSENNAPVCFTHQCTYAQEPWMAIHRDSALEMLKGYNLTEKEKTDVFWLMAGYCRLLDEAGLIHYGQTEAEAVSKACGVLPPQQAKAETIKEIPCPDCYGGHFRPCQMCGDSGVALLRVESPNSVVSDGSQPFVPRHVSERKS